MWFEGSCFFCLIVGVDVSILLDFVSWIYFWIEWFTFPPVIRHSNVNGNVQDPKIEVPYLWGYSRYIGLPILLYMVGTSNLGSWNGHWQWDISINRGFSKHHLWIGRCRHVWLPDGWFGGFCSLVLDHPVFEHVDEKRCFCVFFVTFSSMKKPEKVLSCLDALDGIIVLTLSTALISIFAR